MSGPGRQVLQWLTDGSQTGRPLVMVFNDDGTLSPVADQSRGVKLGSAVRQALAELAARENVFVGIVSGRGLSEIKEQVGLPDLYYAGSGGLELDLLGIQVVPPNAEIGQELLTELEEQLVKLAENDPGTQVERKPLGLVIHYRKQSAEGDESPANKANGTFEARLRRAIRPWGDQFKIWDVSRGTQGTFEIVPALGAGKATAVERFVEDAARDALPFYAGDQADDAEALTRVTDLGGLAVGVGPDAPSAARIVLDSPRELVQVIQQFLSEVPPVGRT